MCNFCSVYPNLFPAYLAICNHSPNKPCRVARTNWLSSITALQKDLGCEGKSHWPALHPISKVNCNQLLYKTITTWTYSSLTLWKRLKSLLLLFFHPLSIPRSKRSCYNNNGMRSFKKFQILTNLI